MSYREENGQVVLTMSREDYESLLLFLGYATGAAAIRGEFREGDSIIALTNRLNTGNPNYKPYEIAENPNADALCNCGRKYYEHRESGYKHAALKLDHTFRPKS